MLKGSENQTTKELTKSEVTVYRQGHKITITIPDKIISYLHHFHPQDPHKLWRVQGFVVGVWCLVGPGQGWAVVPSQGMFRKG